MSKLEFEEQAQQVREWFDLVVNGYITEDLKQLMNIPANLEKGGCAVALAMTAFSAMNLLGFLITSKKLDPKNTTYSVTAFVCTRMKNLKGKDWYRSSDLAKGLVKLFRHGFAHQFLPGSLTIARGSRNGKLLGKASDGSHILSADVLAGDVLDAIELLSEDVHDDNKRDLIELMFEKLKKLHEFNAGSFIEMDPDKYLDNADIVVTELHTNTGTSDFGIPNEWFVTSGGGKVPTIK